MPELPDVEIYREALAARVEGATLREVELRNPFLLRTAQPPLASLFERKVTGIERLGKRIVLAFEILHRAKLSPLALTRKLDESEIAQLYTATQEVLTEWTARLRDEAGDAFPARVTAFRPGMAVHGRYREPCPVCGAPVQRIVYAENEANYCARCQTGGVVLADRALSRVLHKGFKRTLDD